AFEAHGADARAACRPRAAAAALAVLLPLGALALYGALSPEIAFVAPGPRTPWIMAPLPVSAQLEQWGRIDVPVTSFARTFERTGDAPLHLRVRALRGFELRVNGALAASDDGARWREPREVDATPWLRAGANELRVDVARATGPALLEVVAEEEPALGTSSDWQVRIAGGPCGAAIRAGDPVRGPRPAAGGRAARGGRPRRRAARGALRRGRRRLAPRRAPPRGPRRASRRALPRRRRRGLGLPLRGEGGAHPRRGGLRRAPPPPLRGLDPREPRAPARDRRLVDLPPAALLRALGTAAPRPRAGRRRAERAALRRRLPRRRRDLPARAPPLRR